MIEIGPKKLQQTVKAGFKRLKNFRNARVLFIRQFVGQYYDKTQGSIGTEPLNLIYNAIRVMVPHLVMKFPKHVVTSEYLAYRPYADLLGKGLDFLSKKIDYKQTLRQWVVDALFMMGIIKTGLCESDSLMYFSEDEAIDVGRPFAEPCDFEDWFIDPDCRDLKAPTIVGHRVRVARSKIMDSGLYKNEVIEQIPRVSRMGQTQEVEDLSKQSVRDAEGLFEEIDLVESWVPAANVLVTTPYGGPMQDTYCRITDYQGPDTGPFRYLCLSPSPPNNPIPVAPVGIWQDLHVLANKMAVKTIDQAMAQKDVLAYARAAADDAEEIMRAKNLDVVSVNDPDSVKMMSFGGQQTSNDQFIDRLQLWFNLMAGNPEALGGIAERSGTATQAQILQGNAAIQLDDLKDIVYDGAAGVSRDLAWYLYTDPFIKLPLIQRDTKPMEVRTQPDGTIQILMPTVEERQVFLTPAARRGDFLDYHFGIKPKSMSRIDPKLRLQRALEFAVKVVPAAATAAQLCQQMGVQFSFPRFVSLVAEELDIEWMDEVFQDPAFLAQMQMQMMAAPQQAGSQGSPIASILQNQMAGGQVTPQGKLDRREAQRTGGEGQQMFGSQPKM